MENILTRDTSDGVTETISYDQGSQTILVRRSQDVQPIIDAVAAANLDGVREVEGLGVMQSEVPVTVAIKFCEERGIPWEAFLYTNRYNDEWGRFLLQHPKFCYRPAKRVHAVSG